MRSRFLSFLDACNALRMANMTPTPNKTDGSPVAWEWDDGYSSQVYWKTISVLTEPDIFAPWSRGRRQGCGRCCRTWSSDQPGCRGLTAHGNPKTVIASLWLLRIAAENARVKLTQVPFVRRRPVSGSYLISSVVQSPRDMT